MEYNFWLFYIGGMAAAYIGLKSKKKYFCMFLAYTAIFIVMSSAVPESDLIAYERKYLSMQSFMDATLSNDWAFYNLMYLLKTLGFSFMEAKAILMLLIVCLLYRFLCIFSPNVRLYTAFFFLYSMVFQTSFILRNGIGFMICLQGFRSLILKQKHRTSKYIIMVLVASQFHSSLYLLLFFALIEINLLTLKKYRKALIPTIAVSVLFIGLIVRYGTLVPTLAHIIANIIDSDKYIAYAIVRGRFAWISIALIWIVTVGVSIYFTKAAVKLGQWKSDYFSVYEYDKKKGVLINYFYNVDRSNQSLQMIKIIVLACFLIPLTIFSLHLYRYLHYIAIIFIADMGLCYETSKKNKDKAECFVCSFIVMSAWLFFEIFIYGIDLELLDSMMVQGTWFWK